MPVEVIPDDHVGGIDDRGIGHVLDAHVPPAVPGHRSHRIPLVGRGAASPRRGPARTRARGRETGPVAPRTFEPPRSGNPARRERRRHRGNRQRGQRGDRDACSPDPVVEGSWASRAAGRRRCRTAVRWVSADVAADDLSGAMRGADAVIHLAWAIQPSRDPDRLWRTNVVGSSRVVAAARAAGVGTLVHASSVGVYSRGPKDRAVDESWPREGVPTSFYGRHKAEVEHRLDAVGGGGARPQDRAHATRPGVLPGRRLRDPPAVPRRADPPDPARPDPHPGRARRRPAPVPGGPLGRRRPRPTAWP